MNGRLSKNRSVHTYVIPQTVYFDWICTPFDTRQNYDILNYVQKRSPIYMTDNRSFMKRFLSHIILYIPWSHLITEFYCIKTEKWRNRWRIYVVIFKSISTCKHFEGVLEKYHLITIGVKFDEPESHGAWPVESFQNMAHFLATRMTRWSKVLLIIIMAKWKCFMDNSSFLINCNIWLAVYHTSNL